LCDLAKRLQTYETKHNMSSEYFFEQYSKGLLADDIIYIEWSNDYRHYIALHNEIEERLHQFYDFVQIKLFIEDLYHDSR
jgi:hypothetical protein